ncbi:MULTISPECIES: dermonecrotic toxin domain-containing protein [unclassified Pseudomonas]|uniref:dermonecrotic toxin domain-containing protein n=1 Tax=unclassified Pseudomonas TaxID=196821 RepID=UPI002AC9D8A4|nr:MULTISPECIES: DUF6543 domain-containing protein [unclassified Pseudomonas]MEB0048433.1 hypothetical protein [Pseudomonas sp. Dout3]MEB0098017.1 hypothetical protein [Pseudomonas sp. DC1.2]WPX57043.1 hypothetical protein RHM68_15445 [Pseudomonas sp. DC1.2]
MQDRSLSSSTYVDIQARAVNAQFSDRPTLRQVVAKRLEDFITESVAALDTPITQINVASPNVLGGYDTTPLLEVALHYLARGELPDLSNKIDDRECYLITPRATRVRYRAISGDYPATAPDMPLIERALRQLPSTVHIGFQQALTDYWNAQADTGTSRWQWLGDQLRNSLRSTAIRQPGLDNEQRALLNRLADNPDSQEHAAASNIIDQIHAYCIETTVTKAMSSTTLLATAILLVQGERVLLWNTSGVAEPFRSIDAFGAAWGKNLAATLDIDTLVWKRYEPAGDIFDIQAALLLNQQLEDLEIVKLPAQMSKSQLQQRFHEITDITPLFHGPSFSNPAPLRLMQSALPGWLRHAEVIDQLAYRTHSLELTSLNQAATGKSWTDGINDIRVFAAKALQQQMHQDHPLAPLYEPGELELTFHVPVGDLGSGYIQPVVMSLTELTLKNLAGRPKGRMTFRYTGEGATQEWMTPDYLLSLVTVVDVGKTYPQLIRDLLLSGTPDAQKRQDLFAAELKVALPMKALEHSIKHENGVTRRGYQCICAVLRPSYADRVIDGQEVVIRPLAFSRKADGYDVVDNMFIIEPKDTNIGPHLLYRPIYSASLFEYPTREALMADIAKHGDLQQSVLAWLPERARPIYDNGGFNEPHIHQFSQIDPFGIPEKPEPASLAPDDDSSELLQSLHNGTLMQYLFGSEARALVNLGDRDSVSNAESRWAILLEGGWTLFNTLLALPLSGPIMLAGWMMSMTASLIKDIPQLDSEDPTTREVAWVDFLMNIAMLLLHGAHKLESPAQSVSEEGLAKSRIALDSVRRPPNQSVNDRPSATITSGAIGLPAEPPGGGNTLLDFDKSRGRDSSTTRLLEQLREVRVNWPTGTFEPLQTGVFRGLYKINYQWHATVAGLFFRVHIVPGLGEVYIIHPEKPDHPGIKLKSDGRGHWTLEQGLKLTGGGPKNRMAAKQRENLEKLENLALEKQPTHTAQIDGIENFKQAAEQLDIAQAAYAQQVKKLHLIWMLIENANEYQKPALLTRHATELEKTQNIWLNTLEKLQALQANAMSLEQIRRQLIDFSRRENEFDRTDAPTQQRAKLFSAIASSQLVVQNHAVSLSSDFLQGSTAGEPLTTLANRVQATLDAGDPLPYRKYIQALGSTYQFDQHIYEWTRRFESTIDEMQADSTQAARERNNLLKAVDGSAVLNELNIKLQDLEILRELSVDRSVVSPTPFQDLYTTLPPLKTFKDAIISHIAIRSTAGFTFEERQAVYETLINQYQATEDASLLLNEYGPQFSRAPYNQRFIDDIRAARQSAESDLAQLILEQENLPATASQSKSAKERSANRRVFRTRNQRTLVGELQEPAAGNEGEVIEIRDPLTKQTISRYHKHAEENEYVLEVEQTPTPPPVTRSVKAIIDAGNKLLMEGKKLETLIDREMSQMIRDPVLREEKTPADWDTLLTQRAGDLEGLATELQKAPHLSPQKTAMLSELSAAAQALRTKGTGYRIAGYKLQSPTPDKIDFLWTHHAVDIEPISTRKPTQAADFLTEFVIKDKHSREPLWYAHFHYARLDAKADAFTAGHLKTSAQRFLGFKTQLSQAKNDREITRIWRSKVSPAMARKLFFYN